MPALGEIKQCPNCRQPRMYWEVWLGTGEERGQCGFCGFFYEKTYLYCLEWRLRKAGIGSEEEVQRWLAEQRFHVDGRVAFRMGMMSEPDDEEEGVGDRGSIFLTWFNIPSPDPRFSLGIEWIDLSTDEWQPFCYWEWEAIDRPAEPL